MPWGSSRSRASRTRLRIELLAEGDEQPAWDRHVEADREEGGEPGLARALAEDVLHGGLGEREQRVAQLVGHRPLVLDPVDRSAAGLAERALRIA